MFKDAEEELERLETALLEAEEAQPPVSAHTQVFPAYNTDSAELDPEELSQALLQPRRRSLTGLALFMGLMTALVVGLVIWAILHSKGVW